jgi:Cu/Zn superoxide dismutase
LEDAPHICETPQHTQASGFSGANVKRITKAALGGLAGFGLILGATQAAIGESKFITFDSGVKALADLQPAESGGPLDGASASLRIIESPDEGTGFRLRVTGVNTAVAKPEFGAHLHVGPCTARQVLTDLDTTGGHYRNDTLQASPQNEVWFTLATDDEGVANDETWVSFRPRDTLTPGAMSVVLHELPTDATTPNGFAGDREACLQVDVSDWAVVPN